MCRTVGNKFTLQAKRFLTHYGQGHDESLIDMVLRERFQCRRAMVLVQL